MNFAINGSNVRSAASRGILPNRLTYSGLRFAILLSTWIGLLASFAQAAPDYEHDVAPILKSFCAGCHQAAATEEHGELSLTTWEELQRGGEHGAVFVAGKPTESRISQVLDETSDSHMPPADAPQLSVDQIATIRAWIEAGAVGPSAPQVALQAAPITNRPIQRTPKPITALGWSPRSTLLAVGRFGHVDLVTDEQQFIGRLEPQMGKVQAIAFDATGRQLLVATGVPGVSGEARLWDLDSGTLIRTFSGHVDILYAAKFSPDGRWIATAGYDRQIRLWNRADGELRHTLIGHHGAVMDLAFSPDGELLASASADATVKIWQTTSGLRLDTLSQPLKEQWTVDISPDGQFVVAGGADNRLRLWRLVSRTEPQINPLITVRFAHESPIFRVNFLDQGTRVASLGGDRHLKIWDVPQLQFLQGFVQSKESAQAMAISPDASTIIVGRMDGGWEKYAVGPTATTPDLAAATPAKSSLEQLIQDNLANTDESTVIDEVEPNNDVASAQPIELPVTIRGRIQGVNRPTDVDLSTFRAKRGDEWIIEVEAARKGSSLDSYVRILDDHGQPVPRVVMQAVRDSYFTFRGKDSFQTGDFRLHNWEEMRVNQYLYSAGEVVKLYHYPRGPDSGFNVYPNVGNRHTYFDTTPIVHALNEPAYVVEPFPPGTTLPANGLPSFLINYENDDESWRHLGADSYLQFTAPKDGTYVVELTDARQFHGDAFHYQLHLRKARPDFTATVSPNGFQVPAGAGQSFQIEIDRHDRFDGAVQLEIAAPPPGWKITSPLVIESGHFRVRGMIFAPVDAAPLASPVELSIIARAKLQGHEITREIGKLTNIQLAAAAPIRIAFGGVPAATGDAPLPVIEVVAGTTATARIRIDRMDFKERVGFGSEDAVGNVPHGVFVANSGLNGVLITEAESERDVFIHAEPWVEPGERTVFIEAEINGRPCSAPAQLRIVAPAR